MLKTYPGGKASARTDYAAGAQSAIARNSVQQTKRSLAFSLTAFKSCLMGLARGFITLVMLTLP